MGCLPVSEENHWRKSERGGVGAKGDWGLGKRQQNNASFVQDIKRKEKKNKSGICLLRDHTLRANQLALTP